MLRKRTYIYSLFSFLLFTFVSTKLHSQNPVFQWAKGFNGNSAGYGMCVHTDQAGNIFSAGYFVGTTDFDPGPGVFTLSASNTNMYVSKLTPSGNFVQVSQITTTGIAMCTPYDILTDQNGNSYTSGTFIGVNDFDPGPGVYTMTGSAGGGDAFILKLDPAGNFLWAASFGSLGTDYGSSVSLDASGNILLTGTFQFTVDFDPGPGTYTFATQGGSSDCFFVKLNSAGNFIWAKRFAGGSGMCNPRSMKIDGSGNIFTTGLLNGNNFDFDPGPGSYTLSGAQDIFISKMDALGNFAWAESIGSGSGQDYAESLALDASSNVYVSGYFQYTVDFDPGPGVFTLTATGNFDPFVFKLNSNGNFSWAKCVTTSTNSFGYGVTLDALSNVYLGGSFSGTADFDPGPGVFTITSQGSNGDGFILKLDMNGNYIWVGDMGQTGYSTFYDITIDPFESIITTGAYNNSIDFDPGAGIFTLTAGGTNDAFVHKMNQCGALSASITGQNILCNEGNNGTATVTANGGGPFTYSWSQGGVTTATIGSLIAGTYTCNVTNNCGATIAQTVLLSQPNSSVNLLTSSSSTLLCSGQSATLNASASGGTGPLSYSWTSLGINQTIVVNPSVTTVYTMVVTDQNGCTGIAMITESVVICAGANEIVVDDVILKLFPNPTASELFVDCTCKITTDLMIQLIDATGKICFEDVLVLGKRSIDISELKSGIYLVKFKNSNTALSVKLIKN